LPNRSRFYRRRAAGHRAADEDEVAAAARACDASPRDKGKQGEATVMRHRLYGIRNCDTVRKARAWLEDHGVDYEFHDFQAAGIDRETLQSWCRRFGWEKVLNRSGTTFRRLPDAQKEGVDEARAIALMLAQPSMIKRPVLQAGQRWSIGFDAARYGELLDA
jgi:arsenate reductase